MATAHRCPVCGTANAVCRGASAGKDPSMGLVRSVRQGGRTEAVELVRARDGKGNVFSVTREQAAKLGYTLVEAPAAPEAERSEPLRGEGASFDEAADDLVATVEAEADSKARKAAANKARKAAPNKAR